MIRTRFKAFTTLPLLMATAPALAEDTADTTLETIVVQSGQAGVPAPNKTSRLLPAAPGGQVATGSGLGVLGNRDAMSPASTARATNGSAATSATTGAPAQRPRSAAESGETSVTASSAAISFSMPPARFPSRAHGC